MNNGKKVAVLSGISGQAAPYLAQILLKDGYEVYGMIRRVSHPNDDFIKEMCLQDVKLIEGDLSDSTSLNRIINITKPDLFFNCAAQSHVGTSFNQPEHTADVTGLGVLRILEQIRLYSPHTKFIQCSSSEQFGDIIESPQNENTEFRPRSPYANAKVFAHNTCKVYRESYGIFAACGIMFNYESPRRGLNFVTRKITNYIGQKKANLVNLPLELGNICSQRDWGFAEDYMRGLYLISQQEQPDDYVFATNEMHSVREFVELAFEISGMGKIRWAKSGVDEIGILRSSSERYADWLKYKDFNYASQEVVVKIDPGLYRPSEVNQLLGDYKKAKEILGWEPKVKFKELVRIMVNADIERYKNVHPQNNPNISEEIETA